MRVFLLVFSEVSPAEEGKKTLTSKSMLLLLSRKREKA
jgi:hypothetical protein